MSGKKTKAKNVTKVNEIINKQPITQTLKTNYMPYAMSVIVSRAIPEIDGLKPAHRKLLYTMYKMGLLTSNNRTKSANIVGQTMKLNPHGDMAIYETMVRLTKANEALLHPLVDSKGNFGKQYSRDMAFAAPRYTEARLAPICSELFKDIEKNNIDFVDNYDNTMKEPTLLPTTFPNILVNPNQGIAVGMASTICSFNLAEICEATSQILKGKKVNLIDIIPAPDFSTGGEIVYNKGEMEQIYEKGRGTFKIRAKYVFDKKHNCIEIKEIPYTTTIEEIIEKVVELMRTGKIKEINDIRDETDLQGLKIAIDVKKGFDAELLMQKLFKLTPLENTFPCNFNILIKGNPVVLGIREILDEWIFFRIDCVKRSSTYDITRKKERLHLLEGLKKILLNIDKAIKIIRNSETDSLVIENLMNGFKIDKIQAEFIAEIKLRNLNKDYILQKINDINKLITEIAELEDFVSNEKKIKTYIAADLQRISKKFGQPRKTTYINHDDIIEIKEEDMIEDYPCKMVLLNSNYLKKLQDSAKIQNTEMKLKDEDDFVLQEVECTNKSDILFFTNKGNVYKSKVYEIQDTKPSNLGDYLPNLLQAEGDEKVVLICCTKNYCEKIILFFENGKATKIPLASYETKSNRKKLVNAISTLSPLKKGFCVNDEVTLIVRMSNDKKIKIPSDQIPEKSTKNNQGKQMFPIRKNAFVKDISIVSED